MSRNIIRSEELTRTNYASWTDGLAGGARLGLGHGTDGDSCGEAYSAYCGSDRGGKLALFPSPVFAAGSYEVLAATCSLYWGGLGLLSSSPVNRSGGDTYYAAAATRRLALNTDTEDGLGSKDLNVSITTKPASFIRSPRDIAFRSETKPSNSTYLMCRSHYRLSSFL